MLLRLPASLPAALPCPLAPQWRKSFHRTFRLDRGLRILFCGADDFSIASLRALNDARLNDPRLIDSIEVVHRKAKYVGRGLSLLKEVPIKTFAAGLGLTTHACDDFKKWRPSLSIDLVVAVSFGLFIPQTILGQATHGGLNVHPSLLPDLRGAAPVEHAIMKNRQYTGVSVQVLHPLHFDQGTVIMQTPAPGIPVSDKTGAELKAELAEIGADMLMEVLKTGKYMEPHQKAGWYNKQLGPIDAAPKIEKADAFWDLNHHNLETMLLKQRALGPIWCILPNTHRLIMHHIVDTGKTDSHMRIPGIYVQHGHPYPLIRDRHGSIGEIRESTYAGGAAKEGNKLLFRLFKHEEGEDRLLMPEENIDNTQNVAIDHVP